MGEIKEKLKLLLLKDLRNQCRARGLNPGGSREVLAERIEEHMELTGDYTIVEEFNGAHLSSASTSSPTKKAATGLAVGAAPELLGHNNNYVRPEGQNVGNFISDKPSSRVLAPPGGGTSVTLGIDASSSAALAPRAPRDFDLEPGYGVDHTGYRKNNYVRPEGQNVGNFISEKPSSRVLAPPGGTTNVCLG